MLIFVLSFLIYSFTNDIFCIYGGDSAFSLASILVKNQPFSLEQQKCRKRVLKMFEAITTVSFVQDLVSRHGLLEFYENAFINGGFIF